jgi:DNA-directed RNA polymerase specialized sigma24 family protein
VLVGEQRLDVLEDVHGVGQVAEQFEEPLARQPRVREPERLAQGPERFGYRVAFAGAPFSPEEQAGLVALRDALRAVADELELGVESVQGLRHVVLSCGLLPHDHGGGSNTLTTRRAIARLVARWGRNHYVNTAPTEAELVAAIAKVSQALARHHAFGPFTEEDIAQEVAVMSLEAMPRYRPEVACLESFLSANAKNRLLNLRRDRLRRADGPCVDCRRGVEHVPTTQCVKHKKWARLQEKKAALTQRASNLGAASERPGPGDIEADVQTRDLLAQVDEHLPLDLRADWLRLRAGQHVALGRRLLVEDAVREIVGESIR